MHEHNGAIHLAGTTLDRYRHVCAFFHTRDEEYQVLLPFIKEGIERHEKAFHIVDPALRHDHVHRLEEAGIDVTTCESSGQLEVRLWEEAYLRQGHFDQHAMLAKRLLQARIGGTHERTLLGDEGLDVAENNLLNFGRQPLPKVVIGYHVVSGPLVARHT